MKTSSASHGVQTSQLKNNGRYNGNATPRRFQMNINANTATMMICNPRPAEVALTERSSHPNVSNGTKCEPNGVCKKWCMASFHAGAQGKKGGRRFCTARYHVL